MIERLDISSANKYSATEASIHLARYLAAKPFVTGKHVLDVACGEGYGSYLMKTWGARNVCGVDVDERTILKARQIFAEDGLSYTNADAEALPFPDYCFDTVVSFETIEHLTAPEKFLAELKRVLKPGGTVLLSCPNDYYYYENEPVDNPFHKHKYHFFDFKELAEAHLGKAAKYYLGFATDGFVTIPIENSTLPEDQAALDTMLELFRYRMSNNVALLKQERLINHWNSNYYLGVWTSDFEADAISAAIYPRETFLKPEDFDIEFYQEVRKRLEYEEDQKRMEEKQMVIEREALERENNELKEQVTALEAQIAETKTQTVEMVSTCEKRAKSECAILKTENERLKMMLEFANKEIAVLYNTLPARTTGAGVQYIAVDETVDRNLVAQLNYYKNECSRYENSTCWKITKPLRVIMDFLKKLFH